MTTLSTHILDTMHGVPAVGVPVRLSGAGGALFAGTSDSDGRCPALRAIDLAAGRYRLDFEVADYFRRQGVVLPDPPFLDEIGIAFAVGGAGHYHVPLLVSPFAYSTYRGS